MYIYNTKRGKKTKENQKERKERRLTHAGGPLGTQIENRDLLGTQIKEKSRESTRVANQGKIGPGPIEHVNREETELYRDLTGIFGDSTGIFGN